MLQSFIEQRSVASTAEHRTTSYNITIYAIYNHILRRYIYIHIFRYEC